MKNFLFLFSLVFFGCFVQAQVQHLGRHDDLLLVGTQSYLNAAGQKIAEVKYSDEGELLGFMTWDEKGLLIDDVHANPKRKRVEWPADIEFKFSPEGIGYYIPTTSPTTDLPHPTDGDKVLMHYELVLQDQTLIDESFSGRRPFRFVFGKKEVIPGFEKAVSMLVVGQEGYFYIPQAWAYGERSIGGMPPFSALLYRIRLVGLE